MSWPAMALIAIVVITAAAIAVAAAKPGKETDPHAPRMPSDFAPTSVDEWLGQTDCPEPCKPKTFRRDGHEWCNVHMNTMTYTVAEQCHLCGARRVFENAY